jgi:hypothetical protein
MNRVLADLAAIASRTPLLTLAATQYAYNAQDATIELRYKPTTPLTELQDAVLQAINPIRGSLLGERDPSGHLLSDLITLPGKAGDNIGQGPTCTPNRPARRLTIEATVQL